MKVSIIIPTKDAGDLFEAVLKGIRNQKFDDEVELVVVDSGSTDGTVEAAEKYGARVLRIPPEEFNHGLTRDYGIKNSSGEYVLLMTQDALPRNELWLKTIIGTFTDEAIAGVYVKQLPRGDADVLTKRNLNAWLTGRGELAVQEIGDAMAFEAMTPDEKFRLCVFDNVCSAVRRSVWEKIPFGKNDFGEDIDWAKRVLLAGWKIVYQPRAAVIHSHNRSVMYEYKRTYMTHRKLYELFHLEKIPSRSALFGSVRNEIRVDFRYVLKNEPDFKRKLKLSLRAPFWLIARAFGQYRGARDEKMSSGTRKKGV